MVRCLENVRIKSKDQEKKNTKLNDKNLIYLEIKLKTTK